MGILRILVGAITGQCMRVSAYGFFGNVMMLLKELDVICTAFEVAIFMFP